MSLVETYWLHGYCAERPRQVLRRWVPSPGGIHPGIGTAQASNRINEESDIFGCGGPQPPLFAFQRNGSHFEHGRPLDLGQNPLAISGVTTLYFVHKLGSKAPPRRRQRRC
jgi:hypothetical protein